MKRTYPRIGEARKIPVNQNHGRGKCLVCQARADWKIDIQVNEFRGDDDVVRACAEHGKGNQSTVLLAAWNVSVYGGEVPPLSVMI